MPTDLRKVAHLGSRVETTPERAREVIVYLSEVHEFDLMPVEVVDDAGRTTHRRRVVRRGGGRQPLPVVVLLDEVALLIPPEQGG
jgi:hypothetical protein